MKVVRRLTRFGFAAFLVGGCVRDILAGQTPKDFDIATDARPRQVKRLFRNSRIIGRRFRLVHITFENKILEVSTFRATLDQPAGSDDLLIRHDSVFGTPEEDARRRDFTINGLFYDLEQDEVIDYVGGLEDVKRRVIRTIGDPWTRLREDPVRMLRAIKFAGRLGFRISDDLYQAIVDCREDIRKSAAPRIFEEIVRLMNRGGAWPSMRLLYKTGMMEILLPEVAAAVDARLAAGQPSMVWGCLQEADRQMREDEEAVSHAVLLACLFAAPLEELLYDQEQDTSLGDLAVAVDELLVPAALRLRMSKRDTYRVKQILISQRRLGTPRGSSRRRLSAGSLAGRESFPEALDLFRLRSRALGVDAERVAFWEELSVKQAPPLGEGGRPRRGPRRRRS